MTLYNKQDLLDVFNRKHRKYADGKFGWGPQLRLQFGYFSPDDIYETAVAALVNKETEWMDVGCGHQIFPSNVPTAKILAERCRLLFGLDPSDNIDKNKLIHQSFKGMLEDFDRDQQFDLVTLRMVAEHITNPESAVATLGRICKPGGRVVIYTVYKWAPIAIISALLPFALHQKITGIFFKSKEEDVFPTAYKMNTRQKLRELFQKEQFEEEQFAYLDDCRALGRWKFANTMELAVWKMLNAVHLHYPEVCLLGIYRKRRGA